MTRDEHEAHRALVRRRIRQGLQLLVETIQSLPDDATHRSLGCPWPATASRSKSTGMDLKSR